MIVDHLPDWKWPTDDLNIVTAESFLGLHKPDSGAYPRVINLCRRYGYLTGGYYCSLLAEARGQFALPTVGDIVALSRKNLYAEMLADLDNMLQRTMKRLASLPEQPFDLYVYFGQSSDNRFRRLAAAAFDTFRYPALRLRIVSDRRWRIASIRPVGIRKLPRDHEDQFIAAMRTFTRARKLERVNRPVSLYSLAVLQEPGEFLPPSDHTALENFIRTGRGLAMDVELVSPRDLRRIPEFDALFIRATTAIDHYTFQFARKAELEGIPVIDDPASILRCTNKVFMNELLVTRGLSTPRAEPLDRREFDDERIAELEVRLGYPIVLKIPDGSFSRGVIKAENREELRRQAALLFKRSRIILAQEYMYTAFDWRVGVLAGKPLFVCQYEMSRAHWQIYRHKDDGTVKEGRYTTMAVADAPKQVVKLAVDAAALIGDGFYGIDLKQTENGVYIIEINDNPSLESGVEDKVLKGELYDTILRDFIRRIEKSRGH